MNRSDEWNAIVAQLFFICKVTTEIITRRKNSTRLRVYIVVETIWLVTGDALVGIWVCLEMPGSKIKKNQTHWFFTMSFPITWYLQHSVSENNETWQHLFLEIGKDYNKVQNQIIKLKYQNNGSTNMQIFLTCTGIKYPTEQN